jgi:LemA protein
MMPTEKSFFEKNTKKIVIWGVVALLVLWVIFSFNSLITQDKAVTAQWAQVENQLQRRFDLIPSLVETVRGVTKQEITVFSAISEARKKYAGSTNSDDKAQAASQYESAVSRLLVITENYPVLQSSQSFRDLMTSLEGTENRIAVERMKYNQMVQTFDTSISKFPAMFIAKLFGFGEKAYFKVDDSAKENPQIKF